MVNPTMRHRLFEEMIEPFAESLAAGIQLPYSVLAALFELQIVMISQCPENWPLAEQFLNARHWSRAFDLISDNQDSLSQMLITEWMWRVKNRTNGRIDCLGKFEPLFNDINVENFRASLHSFVRAVNKESTARISHRVVHVQYSGIKVNGIEARCSGWIDFNQETVVLWLFSKPPDLPDVVVFRLKHISDPTVDPSHVRFSTREKVTAFDRITSQRPLAFDFTVVSSAQSAINELGKRLNNGVKDPPRKLAEPKNRVFAEKAEDIIAKKPAPKPKSADGVSTQDQDLTVDQLERQVSEFYTRSKASIDDLESKVTTELRDIVARVTDQKRTLLQLQQQHQQMAHATTAENTRIAAAVAALESEAEMRHGETMKKREAISAAVLKEIAEVKQQFLEETDAAFKQNAIVALAENLTNLQEAVSFA
jgi:hypothetical protein